MPNRVSIQTGQKITPQLVKVIMHRGRPLFSSPSIRCERNTRGPARQVDTSRADTEYRWRKSTLVSFALLVAAVAVLAGCGGTVTRITSAPSPPSTTEPGMQDAAFILALDKEGIPYQSKSGIIDMAHFICDDLRTHPNRTSTDAALLIMETSPLGAADAGFLTGAAVNVYCPEFKAR